MKSKTSKTSSVKVTKIDSSDLVKNKKNTQKITIEDVIKNKKDVDIKITEKERKNIIPFKYLSFMSFKTLSFWKDRHALRNNKPRTFLVLMKLKNNKNVLFLAKTTDNTFKYRGGEYMVDSDFMEEEIHTGLSMLYYHQNCAVPFKISFNISKLVQKLKDSNFDAVEKAINPQTLKGFINSQVIEKVLKGQEISDELGLLKKLIVITLIISIISIILNAKAMGIF